MIRTHGAFALLALPLFAACNDDDGGVASGGNPAAAGPADSLETIDLTGAPLGIVDLPAVSFNTGSDADGGRRRRRRA